MREGVSVLNSIAISIRSGNCCCNEYLHRICELQGSVSIAYLLFHYVMSIIPSWWKILSVCCCLWAIECPKELDFVFHISYLDVNEQQANCLFSWHQINWINMCSLVDSVQPLIIVLSIMVFEIRLLKLDWMSLQPVCYATWGFCVSWWQKVSNFGSLVMNRRLSLSLVILRTCECCDYVEITLLPKELCQRKNLAIVKKRNLFDHQLWWWLSRRLSSIDFSTDDLGIRLLNVISSHFNNFKILRLGDRFIMLRLTPECYNFKILRLGDFSPDDWGIHLLNVISSSFNNFKDTSTWWSLRYAETYSIWWHKSVRISEPVSCWWEFTGLQNVFFWVAFLQNICTGRNIVSNKKLWRKRVALAVKQGASNLWTDCKKDDDFFLSVMWLRQRKSYFLLLPQLT